MFLEYSPEGQPTQRWHMKPGNFRVPEMKLIQQVSGIKWGQFAAELQLGNIDALQALLWTYLRRQHPALKIEDVDFAGDEVKLVKDVDELEQDLADLEDAKGSMPEAERLAGIAFTRIAIRSAPLSPGKAQAVTPAEPAPQPEALPMDAPAAVSTPTADPALSTS
ncbi:hypothetical protein HH310_12595 [Actinoplanes sp. TBRC 11911]|uniref:hypothetical protein n=1 Tax=Actinoplanes sp. TBRC 11911 TaxID=2729386 RepID=UPI00145E09BA|nr:hypothetical protein [Actinoplanes sp. TBRC 11911]NMO52032.1 hypothetical protein [Actinoplanes sp. TBRC 11911]